MFLGHLAVGLASKRVAPESSLGVLIAAPLALDLVWPILLIVNVEEVRIQPGNTAFTPLDFVSYPYSHSLLMSIVWGLLFGSVYWLRTRYKPGAVTLIAGVLSHWILDLLTHRADLSLAPGTPERFGLGLWNSVPATILVESLLFAAGIWIYVSTTKPKDRVGIYGLWIFLAICVTSYLSNAFGPPPPNSEFLAKFSFALWLFVPLAWWFDRHRETKRLARGSR